MHITVSFDSASSVDGMYLNNPRVRAWFKHTLDQNQWEATGEEGSGIAALTLKNMPADELELVIDCMAEELWGTACDSRGFIVEQFRTKLKKARNARGKFKRKYLDIELS